MACLIGAGFISGYRLTVFVFQLIVCVVYRKAELCRIFRFRYGGNGGVQGHGLGVQFECQCICRDLLTIGRFIDNNGVCALIVRPVLSVDHNAAGDYLLFSAYSLNFNFVGDVLNCKIGCTVIMTRNGYIVIALAYIVLYRDSDLMVFTVGTDIDLNYLQPGHVEHIRAQKLLPVCLCNFRFLVVFDSALNSEFTRLKVVFACVGENHIKGFAAGNTDFKVTGRIAARFDGGHSECEGNTAGDLRGILPGIRSQSDGEYIIIAELCSLDLITALIIKCIGYGTVLSCHRGDERRIRLKPAEMLGHGEGEEVCLFQLFIFIHGDTEAHIKADILPCRSIS